jgi:hypothetical protein
LANITANCVYARHNSTIQQVNKHRKSNQMKLHFTAKVLTIGGEQSFANSFRKTPVIVDTGERYNNVFQIEFHNTVKMTHVDHIAVGGWYEFECDLKVYEKDGRFFYSFMVWSLRETTEPQR